MEQRRELYLPAEWHKQQFVQLTWPHENSDWAYMLQEVEQCFTEIAAAISRRQKLLIVAPDTDAVRQHLQKTSANIQNIRFFQCETNDTWARDHAFITLLGDAVPHYLDFEFNGWGRKFPAELDNAINSKLYDAGVIRGEYEDCLSLVLEGGSIESDGKGTLLTTTHCLMAPHRNQPLTKEQIEQRLQRMLHVKRILWLDHGNLIGDDTDGHIDTIARFAPDDTIVHVRCDDPQDEQFADLQAMEAQLATFRTPEGKPYRMLPLPTPTPIFDENGERLPATYANFLVINGAVLYPTYSQPENDRQASEILSKAFPMHEIIGINCCSLIKQHGSLHCVTMQYPCNERY
ncbi:MAG: agmatine deiminase family protein [Bacteroidaceae bacterium]|nr:agmatine deiminase family protein [Bacteroidaceae bacterium]MBQ3539305.1 agmatine deiminase family protein [Bacteroidaceae bacterium]MBQ6693393.1 agmatine deiminase family protein [Bacteroidaceae bacterium]